MDAISEREMTKDEVVTISRDLLRDAYQSLEDNKEQVAAKIVEGIVDDKILGECPKCHVNKLRIIRSKATRKRFVGCEGYPDCDQTYPLPQRGDISALNETCPECGSPRIKILGGKRPWILCVDPDCPTKAEYKEKRAAAEAAKAAKAEAAAADGDETPKKGRAGAKTPKAKSTKTGTAKAKTSTAKTAAAKPKTAAAKRTTRRAATAVAEAGSEEESA